MAVAVGKMVVIADIGIYLVSIFVTLTCIIVSHYMAPLYWGVNDVL